MISGPSYSKETNKQTIFFDIYKTKTVREKSAPVSDIVSRIPLSDICSDVQILSGRGAWSDRHSLRTTEITASKLGRLRDSSWVLHG